MITQVDACLNSRTLIALSNEPDDASYLSPGHFLVGAPHLWKRWSSYYLQLAAAQQMAQPATRPPARNASAASIR